MTIDHSDENNHDKRLDKTTISGKPLIYFRTATNETVTATNSRMIEVEVNFMQVICNSMKDTKPYRLGKWNINY